MGRPKEELFEAEQGNSLSHETQAADGNKSLSKKPMQNPRKASKAIVKLILTLATIVLGARFIINAINGMQYGKLIGPDIVRGGSNHKHTAEFTFHEPPKFSFVQLLNQNIGCNKKQHVQIGGQVDIKRSTELGKSDIHTVFELHVSDPSLIEPQLFIVTDSGVIINCPRFSRPTPHQSYLMINATIWIPPGITLDTLGVSTESLSINSDPDLDYTITHRTNISSKSGHITSFSPLSVTKNASSIKSRETIIDAGSGSIDGTYSLYDLLSISSSSGSVNVNIELKEASSSSPKPARLRLITSSGSIQAYTPFLSANVPNRTYETDVSSNSGSIDATLVHGKRTSMYTTSGRITASLSPYGPTTSRSDLDVHTTSGSIDVSIQSSLSDPTAPMRKFYASYRTGSASLRLRYPEQWEGIVEGQTSTGSMRINWHDLKIVRDEKTSVGRSIKGVKGEGEGLSRFQVRSGSVDLSG